MLMTTTMRYGPAIDDNDDNKANNDDDGSMMVGSTVPVVSALSGTVFNWQSLLLISGHGFCVQVTRDGGAQVTFLRTVSAMCSS